MMYLYEFENDNYMGSTKLGPEERAYVLDLQQEERKKNARKRKAIG